VTAQPSRLRPVVTLVTPSERTAAVSAAPAPPASVFDRETSPSAAATPAVVDAMPHARRPAPVLTERMLVVIPAYNEQGRVGRVVRDVLHHLPTADVLVIDDGSADGTAREAAQAGASVVSLPVNLGYGAALQTGYKYAVRHDYPLVGQIDADGQHRAAHFLDLLRRLDEAGTDVVIGSRFLDRDGHYVPSRARKLGMAMFGGIASVVTRQHISDPTSGFQILRRPVAQFFSSEVYPSDYPDADILILLHRSGFRVAEVAVQMEPPPGKSMHSGHRSLYYAYKMSLSILVTLLRRGTKGHG
jgi:glycosyltransferase involved in cell wall biosynthesis